MSLLRTMGRRQNSTHSDLVRSNEVDWRSLTDVAERRKMQNRLSQRVYREYNRFLFKPIPLYRVPFLYCPCLLRFFRRPPFPGLTSTSLLMDLIC